MTRSSRDVIRRQRQVEREPINERQLEIMLTVLLRSPSAYAAASKQLEPKHFASHHQAYRVVWQVLGSLHEEFGELPGEDLLATEVEQALGNDIELRDMSDESLEALDTFIRRAYWIPKESIKDGVALSYLQRYREDHLNREIRERTTRTGQTPEDIYSLLASYSAEATQIRSIASVGCDKAFPDDWSLDEAIIDQKQTGVGWFDKLLDGGYAGGEVVGVLGPTGSCKTTLTLQLATTMSQCARLRWRTTDPGRLGQVYVFFYEGDIQEFRLRSICSAATIPRKTLAQGMAALSNAEALKPYEINMWDRGEFSGIVAGDSATPSGMDIIQLGEHERYELARRRLNDNYRLFDMTGNDEQNPGQGAGSIQEVLSIVQADQRRLRDSEEYEPFVEAIFVDYMGAMANRSIQSRGGDYSRELRFELKNAPYFAKHEIAVPLDAPIILLHQLSGAANAVSTCRAPKGTEASETRSFKENLDYCLVLGNPNRENYCMIRQDKHRRSEMIDDVVVKIDGSFGRVISAEEHYILDQNTGQIVSKDDRASIVRPREESGTRHQEDPTEADEGYNRTVQSNIVGGEYAAARHVAEEGDED